ncbi:PREDICTED: phosphatidylinositol N-acetylglucosaminyltransferase subunit Q [Nicrophorus vespilloides]|uniref:Phosphatidylinositol N-acetylglucosaminyltransferase subunit Q n=1 Tax=Nicrophorus vespilloides TaxID=110193 RepID=A0ABM1M5T3_NICVS|nr:PREDICTED: phosphatidylinositol N-acetylglucosaminyltransferase subunit Q [Nicrophorus vespilloides]
MKTFVYLPSRLKGKEGFLTGIPEVIDENLHVFVTKNELSKNEENSIGYFGMDNRNNKDLVFVNSETMEVYYDGCCKGNVLIEYNYNTVQKTQIMDEANGIFIQMVRKARHVEPDPTESMWQKMFTLMFINILHVFDKNEKILKHSSICRQFEKNVFMAKFLLKPNCSHKESLQKANLITARFIDIAFGMITLYYFYKYERYFLNSFQEAAEFIIEGLMGVVNSLMNTPAGLKLNDSLTKTLGIFFFYHIALWRAFIYVVDSILIDLIHFFTIPALMGVSFQIALMSDLIGFLSFHVYCIYVYAARLYGIQIYGLRSLWKLFIGRKYNPLRNRVDSCEYTHNQLFVGTLGFTVLLFLLPTVFIYYAVFTALRLILLTATTLLDILRFFLQHIPLYVFALWIMRSPKIRAEVFMKVGTIEKEFSKIYITLKPMSLWNTVRITMPPMNRVKTAVGITALLSGTFTGNLM